jgi:hypothetical protein
VFRAGTKKSSRNNFPTLTFQCVDCDSSQYIGGVDPVSSLDASPSLPEGLRNKLCSTSNTHCVDTCSDGKTRANLLITKVIETLPKCTGKNFYIPRRKRMRLADFIDSATAWRIGACCERGSRWGTHHRFRRLVIRTECRQSCFDRHRPIWIRHARDNCSRELLIDDVMVVPFQVWR